MAFDLDDDELRETRRMKNLDRDLTVGEYWRTNLGNFIKFAWLVDSDGKIVENKVILISGNKVSNDFYYFHAGEKIVKHSKQLIDLIETRDVLKFKIKGFHFDSVGVVYEDFDVRKHEYYKAINGHTLNQIEIEQILTHEQFEQNSYKVGGKDER